MYGCNTNHTRCRQACYLQNESSYIHFTFLQQSKAKLIETKYQNLLPWRNSWISKNLSGISSGLFPTSKFWVDNPSYLLHMALQGYVWACHTDLLYTPYTKHCIYSYIPLFLTFYIVIHVRHIKLLIQSFTHASVSNGLDALDLGSNQQLEFLGDAILQFLTRWISNWIRKTLIFPLSRYLFIHFPEHQEGQLTVRYIDAIHELTDNFWRKK